MAYRIYPNESDWTARYTDECRQAGHTDPPCEAHRELIRVGVALTEKRLDEATEKQQAAGNDPALRGLRPDDDPEPRPSYSDSHGRLL